MKPNVLPPFSKINQALTKTALKLHPSQLHGLICGMICAKPEIKQGWIETLLGEKKLSITVVKFLNEIALVTVKQLAEFQFGFTLLLPKDTAALHARAEALTLWCQGFLTGLKLFGVPIENRPSSETTEAINDLIEITKMNYEDIQSTEADENDFVELLEYVRVAVNLIYQNCRDVDTEVKKHKHLH